MQIQPFYSSQSFDDCEVYTETIKAWDLDFIQLGSGNFTATRCAFGDDELQVREVSYSRLLYQRGALPSKGFTFAVHHWHTAPTTWRGVDFSSGRMMVSHGNKEYESLSQPNCHPITVTISETLLAEVADAIGLPEPQKCIPENEILRCNSETISEIQQLVKGLMTLVKHISSSNPVTFIPYDKKRELASCLLKAVASSRNIELKKRQYHERKVTVDRLLEFIENDLTTPRSINELCGVAEVSERTLRNLFYEQFTLSPNQFQKRLRMKAVRSRLRTTCYSYGVIGDIANTCGFWHMGEFAKDYRAIFGELPSETIQR